jgi:hypothetical protein
MIMTSKAIEVILISDSVRERDLLRGEEEERNDL